MKNEQSTDKMKEIQKPNHEFWMNCAAEESKKTHCIRPESMIGAVAVKDGQVIAGGSNGVVGKIMKCCERGYCIRKKLNIPSGTQREIAYCICAEQRMICDAARQGVQLNEAEVYVTHKPCAICTRLMIESGISRVYYKADYPNQFTDEICKEAGFEMIKL